ncbi:MAG: hypothetical protein IPF54_20210 [Draconibacterium sp.]|nr:hypothetical protein [Draconibacterium sp.]
MDYSKPRVQTGSGSIIYQSFFISNDPRLVVSVEDAFAVKNINGKKYGFFTDMYDNMLWVYRFDGEIAVPCAGFCVGWGWNGDEVKFNSWNYTEAGWLLTEMTGDGFGPIKTVMAAVCTKPTNTHL